MVCVFCLHETNDGISIFGESTVAQNAREIICKHFWFEISEINTVTSYTCSECWVKVEAFHEFYHTIESIHKRSQDDTKQFNSLFIDALDDDGPDCKTILLITPIEVENLPEIAENNNNGDDSTAENIPQEDACPGEQSSSIEETPINNDLIDVPNKQNHTCASAPKIKQSTRKNATKTSQKDRTKKHPKTVPAIEKLVCFMCHKQYKSVRTLRNHFDLHDPIESRTFECNICDRKFSRELMLKNHILFHGYRQKQIEKGRSIAKCPICEKTLKYSSLWKHMKQFHEDNEPEEKIFMCSTCGKKFKDPSALRQHVVTHIDRQITKVQCEICGKWLKNEYALRSHKSSHVRNLHECPQCGKVKATLRAIQRHISVVHLKPQHMCHFCDKLFTQKKTLREHIATHTGETLYTCMYCEQPFKNDANMYKHLREHHSDQWNLDRAKKSK